METSSGSQVDSDLTAGVSRNGPDSIIKGVRKLRKRQTRHLISLKMNSTASKSGLTRQQKIKVLGQDFLDRDQDRYVKIRRSGRLGWESLIPQGGNYSDLLRNCHGDGDIIKEAYGIARDYIVAMDTPYRVTLRLSPEQNCTDSRVVYLATRVFDDKDLSEILADIPSDQQIAENQEIGETAEYSGSELAAGLTLALDTPKTSLLIKYNRK